MSNDFWNQQQLNGKLPSQHNGAPRSGSLLRDYRHQQQQQGQGFQQYSPLSTPPTYTQGPPPSSPLPPSSGQPHYNGQMPRQQGWPTENNTKQQGQGWVANTMQTVRRWSGRFSAIPPVDQSPLVLYRPSSPLRQELPKTKPWKRSRSMRVSMMMKHRRMRWQQRRPKAQSIASGISLAFL